MENRAILFFMCMPDARAAWFALLSLESALSSSWAFSIASIFFARLLPTGRAVVVLELLDMDEEDPEEREEEEADNDEEEEEEAEEEGEEEEEEETTDAVAPADGTEGVGAARARFRFGLSPVHAENFGAFRSTLHAASYLKGFPCSAT